MPAGFRAWANAVEDPPANPFTIYGTTQKRFEVLELEQGKVVGRKPGVTARACASTLGRDEETSDGGFQGLPVWEKMRGVDGTAKPSCTTKEVTTSSRQAPAREATAAVGKSCSLACKTPTAC